MAKSRARTLYLIGIVATIVGFALFFASSSFSTTTNSLGGTTSTVSQVNNPALLGVSIVVLLIGGVLELVTWIASLIKVAQLQRWGWFVGMLLFSGIGMLIYIFAGPTTPKNAAAAYPPR